MINKICKTSGFKLPHMSPLGYHEKGHKVKAEKPTIKANDPESSMAETRRKLEELSKEPTLQPLEITKPSKGLGPAPKQTVSSSGDEFDVDYSGAQPVDLGTVKLSDKGKAARGFREEFGNYMNREFRGNNPQLGPITPKENFEEAMRELPSKYFDLEKGKLRGYPTDDADIPIPVPGLKSYQVFNPEMFSDQQPKDE